MFYQKLYEELSKIDTSLKSQLDLTLNNIPNSNFSISFGLIPFFNPDVITEDLIIKILIVLNNYSEEFFDRNYQIWLKDELFKVVINSDLESLINQHLTDKNKQIYYIAKKEKEEYETELKKNFYQELYSQLTKNNTNLKIEIDFMLELGWSNYKMSTGINSYLAKQTNNNLVIEVITCFNYYSDIDFSDEYQTWLVTGIFEYSMDRDKLDKLFQKYLSPKNLKLYMEAKNWIPPDLTNWIPPYHTD